MEFAHGGVMEGLQARPKGAPQTWQAEIPTENETVNIEKQEGK